MSFTPKNEIIEKVKLVVELKQKAKGLAREAMLEVASRCCLEDVDSSFLTLITE